MDFQKEKLKLSERIDLWHQRAIAAETENERLRKIVAQQKQKIEELQNLQHNVSIEKDSDHQEKVLALERQVRESQRELAKTTHIASLNEALESAYIGHVENARLSAALGTSLQGTDTRTAFTET